jgi:FKBP-type peptidyl-prolyl cis-trans isomerase (trigger factor)
MDDEYQTRQFFNMKHSELKQIIKEEIRNVLNEEPQSKNTFRPILLPSIDGGSYTEVPTFEKYAQWRAKFKSEYGQYPEFDKSDSKKWKVTNPKFVEKQQMYDKAVRGFGTKGD